MIREVQVRRRGNSVGGSVFFEAIASEDVTMEEVREAQSKAGYDPRGYGGPWAFRFREDGKVTWNCAASAD